MNISNIKIFIRNEYIYSILNKFITILIGMIQSVLLARYLGAELKGMNAYISSITSIGEIVITFGMHQAYPYFRKKLGKEKIYQDFVSLIMYLYMCFLLVSILLAMTLNVSVELKAVFLLIPIQGYARIVAYISLVESPNKRNTWWTIITFLDIIYVLLLWLFTQKSVTTAISLLFFAVTLKCIIYTILLHVKPHLHKGLIWLLKELISYGFMPMLALLMTTLNYRIDVLMLHRYNFITDAMIGVYSLGLSLSDKIVMIPDTLKGILVSKLSKGAPDDEVVKVCRLGFVASLFLCAMIIIFGKPVINLLYGAEYLDSYMIVVITSAGILSVSYFKLIAQYNIVNKKQKLNVYMLSVAIIVDVILNLLFIPKWGIYGAAAATSIGNFVCGIIFIKYFSNVSGIPISQFVTIQKEDLKLVRNIIKKAN